MTTTGGERRDAETVVVADEDAGLRLDRWFRRHYPGLAHGRLQKLLRTGQVRLDGRRVQAGDRVDAGQRVRVPPVELPDPAAMPSRRPAAGAGHVDDRDRLLILDRVLYRDEHVIVVDKPPGLAVQGGTGTRRHLDGMLDALCFGGERPRLVHRLDRDTSGVLVLARTARAAAALTRSFRTRAADKVYWALVAGVPAERAGMIDLPLAKGPGRLGERVAPDLAGGLSARTEFELVDRLGDEAAWLSLRPLTGRTHQLRAHCAAIGTPIVGDGKYGGSAARLAIAPAGHQLHLHARALRIPHPVRGILVAEADLPPHMRETWRLLNFDVPRPAPVRVI